MNFKTFYMKEGTTQIPEELLERGTEWIRKFIYNYILRKYGDSFSGNVKERLAELVGQNDYQSYVRAYKKFPIQSFPYPDKVVNEMDQITVLVQMDRKGTGAFFYNEADPPYIEVRLNHPSLINNPLDRYIGKDENYDDMRTVESVASLGADEARQILRHEIVHMVEWMIGKDVFDLSTNYSTSGEEHDFHPVEFEPMLGEVISIVEQIATKRGPISVKDFRKGMKGNWHAVAMKNGVRIFSSIDTKLESFYNKRPKQWQDSVRKIYGELENRGLIR